MKHWNKSEKLPVANHAIESERTSAAYFHNKRNTKEVKFEATKESSSHPQGNYEYEQMIAEDAYADAKRMIAEAAFFIAERRGFIPGNEESDWLKAEIDVESSLLIAQQVHFKSS